MTYRLVGGQTFNLTYDAENRLTQVSGAAAATFDYDGDGKRVIGLEGGTTTVYIGNYFEWKGSTSTHGEVLLRRRGAGGDAHRGGRPAVAAGRPPGLDQRGSELRWDVCTPRQGYKAWGEKRFPDPLDGSPLPTTFRYTGQRESETFGLYFYGARWYDPELLRWNQPDSIIPNQSDPQDWDRYAYVRNNPIKYMDPYGHSVDCGLGDPYCKAGKLDVTKRANDLLNGFMDKGDNRTWYGLTYTEQSILNEGGILKGVFDDARNGANAKDMSYVWYDPINLVLIVFTAGGMARAFVGLIASSFGVGTATTATTSTGVVVLGRYPQYLKVAETVGGKYFNIPDEIFKNLSSAEQWSLNKAFLDDAIEQGYQFFLASPWSKATPDSFFYKELTYLFSLGYTLSPRGNFLFPP